MANDENKAIHLGKYDKILFHLNSGTSNVEIIKNIKKECESSDHHVLCPKTFACIAKDFLCDGDNGNKFAFSTG